MLLDHMNQLRKQGVERDAAILQAGRDRMRAIVTTASTTIIGLMPLAVGGSWAAGIFYYPLALTVMGGLTSSAVLTLVVLPYVDLGVEGVAGCPNPRIRGREAGFVLVFLLGEENTARGRHHEQQSLTLHLGLRSRRAATPATARRHLTLGRVNQRWAAIRLLEHAPYAEIVRLLGFRRLVAGWPAWRSSIRSESRRRGFDFLVSWLPEHRPDVLGKEPAELS